MGDYPDVFAIAEYTGEDIARIFKLELYKRGSATPRDPVTIEGFVGTLFVYYPEDALTYFGPRESLEKMVADLDSRRSNNASSIMTTGSMESVTSLHVGIDDVCSRVWARAVKIAIAGRRGKAGISEFVASLALEVDTVASLKERRGVELKVSPTPREESDK